jgi:hypothetical protein
LLWWSRSSLTQLAHGLVPAALICRLEPRPHRAPTSRADVT